MEYKPNITKRKENIKQRNYGNINRLMVIYKNG